VLRDLEDPYGSQLGRRGRGQRNAGLRQ